MRDNINQIMKLYQSILNELEEMQLLSQDEKQLALSFLFNKENTIDYLNVA